jgi:hypothetical protein
MYIETFSWVQIFKDQYFKIAFLASSEVTGLYYVCVNIENETRVS